MDTKYDQQDWESRRHLWIRGLTSASNSGQSSGRPLTRRLDSNIPAIAGDPPNDKRFASLLVAALVVMFAFAFGMILLRDLKENERRILSIYWDGVGRVDFAAPYNHATLVWDLTSQGATSKSYPNASSYLGKEIQPSSILGSRRLEPGQCWLIEGAVGQVAIRFALPVQVTHITVDHIPRSLVSSTSNAPRKMRVWGFLTNSLEHLLPQMQADMTLPMLSLPTYSFYSLGEIEYNIMQKDHIQTFPSTRFNKPVEGVVVEILNSWGALNACLYRIRVHGIGGV
ncbi:hypothetical protein CVT24_003134 [Panaeolus cyanescens]|uniref:SUN domain-containing protein n=1 Tax=Panaeolus cyanescens TaxID=181874 RepID=A0A409X224_9AGAR|nr:hypothetical protein CVT24_003134 [Panaeolus cyanescens]